MADNIETYDVIIVGAGAAGCVLAHRLSEQPEARVLLVEAGGSDRHPHVRIPAAFTKLFRTRRDWVFHTVPQRALDGRSLFWPRGKMLGGSSSMNAQMYVRGHRDDYDGWAAAGATGWSFADVRDAFARAERRDAPGYGDAGPQHVEDLRDPNITTAAFLRACDELGMTPLDDLNDPAAPDGFARTPVTQHRGLRWSAADAYLRPARARTNLTVLTGAHVDRILFEGRRATGIAYTIHGAPRTVRARGEIVLAAGAIGSPHLLLRSGVGPAGQLRAAGVDVVADLSGVGENLQDHLLTAVIHACDARVTLVAAESPRNVLSLLFRRRGMLTSNVGEAVAFVRSEPGLAAPDLELLWAPVPYIEHGAVRPRGHGTSIGVILLQPQSRGRIRIAADRTLEIDAGYLTDPEGRDLATMIRGVRAAQRVYATAALAPYVRAPIAPPEGTQGDAALAAFIRARAETLYHPVGTCRIGRDAGAVVDPELRVHGVAGLRVADASVMPRIIRGHTYAPTIMIAERAAAWVTAALRDRPPIELRVRRAAH